MDSHHVYYGEIASICRTDIVITPNVYYFIMGQHIFPRFVAQSYNINERILSRGLFQSTILFTAIKAATEHFFNTISGGHAR